MNYRDLALRFDCQGEELFGVLSLPEQPSRRGVLVVVGGPQYRVGSHRQFALLARGLAAEGFAALRFDYRGMGDSSGPIRTFESVGEDLRAAIDQFFARVPGMTEVVIWGLCDGASAALFYAHQDPRVSGLVLLNPWVRTADGLAKATLKHYYRARLLDPALWKKLASGRFDYRAAAGSLLAQLRAVLGRKPRAANAGASGSGEPLAPLPERMRAGLARFRGEVLFIFSGSDLTAKEFLDLAGGSREWRKLLEAARVSQHHLAEADHTFSRRAWRDQVLNWTAGWIRTPAAVRGKMQQTSTTNEEP
jgi:exosortase A-associated hydrolase 1